MKKLMYILIVILLLLLIIAFWRIIPKNERISSRMPVILVNSETGEMIASKLYTQGTWTSSHYDKKSRFVGNFSVEDISQTRIGGGDQYKLTLVRAGEEYITEDAEIDIASTAPVIKDFRLYIGKDKRVFTGTWDIYLEGHRHKTSRLYFIAPASNIEEARGVIDQFTSLTDIAEIDRVLPH